MTATLDPPPAPPPLPPPAPPAPPPAAPRPQRPPPSPPPILVRVAIIAVGALLTVTVIALTSLGFADSFGRTVESAPLQFGVGIRHVQVDMGFGTMIVRGGDGAEIRGERRVTRALQQPTYRERVEGDRLLIDASCPIVSGIWCDVSYTLDVPSGVTLDIRSGAGSIDVRGVTGNARLRSGAGSVTIDDTRGDLDLESGAGSITGRRLRSASVTASSGAGSTTLQFNAPPERVDAEAGAGSVDIEVPRDDARYRIVVPPQGGPGGGSIDVATDPDASRVIDAEAGAGVVRVHYPAA